MVAISGTVAAPATHAAQQWMTKPEAARQLGVSLPKLQLLIKRGTLTQKANPADKRVRMIRAADVEALMRDGIDGMRLPRWKGKV